MFGPADELKLGGRPRGGVWKDADGIHVVSRLSRVVGSDAANFKHPLVGLATFDTTTGAVKSVRTYDFMPPAIDGVHSGTIWAAGGGPNGLFAVSADWHDEPAARVSAVLVLSAAGETVATRDLGELYAGAISWDGEAFAMHLANPADGLLEARMSTEGELLLPFQKWGATYVSAARAPS